MYQQMNGQFRFKDTRRVDMWAGWQEKTAPVPSMGCFSSERESTQGIINAIYQGGDVGWHCTFPAKSHWTCWAVLCEE